MHTYKNTRVCIYWLCVYMHVLSKKPTHVWFNPCMSHMCEMRVPFKLWVICTISNNFNCMCVCYLIYSFILLDNPKMMLFYHQMMTMFLQVSHYLKFLFCLIKQFQLHMYVVHSHIPLLYCMYTLFMYT